MQLELAWRDERTLRRELEAHAKTPIRLTLTDNTSSMITVRRSRTGGPLTVRLHRMFLTANDGVVRALGKWLRQRRSRVAGEALNEFIRANQHMVGRGKQRLCGELRTEGAHHDLQAMFDDLNVREFGGRVDARLTWGRMPSKRRRRSIRFGSYTPEDHIIRIHPALDQAFVPAHFVRYILFHEMLHADFGVSRGSSGRRRVHPPEFKRRERAFAGYDRAIAWQDAPDNLKRLLGASARQGG